MIVNTINRIVENHLCVQCGACVSACQIQAIEMIETPPGMLLPYIMKEKCNRCGLCLEVCPGTGIEIDLPEHTDPFKGKVSGAFIGYTCDHEVRNKGQSGGVASALLLYLLDTGLIDGAMVTEMPFNSRLKARPLYATTRDELLASQGSKYCPVALNSILNVIPENDQTAIVGLPCQMHGIEKLSRQKNILSANINYKIGLFCDRTLLYSCIDQMASNANIKMNDIKGLEYRSKARNGWPGEVCFHFHASESKYFPASLRMDLKDFFTPPRCRLCFDKMNIFSDISIGDPHGLVKSTDGASVIISRSRKGLSLINEAKNQGYLSLKEIDPELVFKGQGIDNVRQRLVDYFDACREVGQAIPEYKGLNSSFLPSVGLKNRRNVRSMFLFNQKIIQSTSRKQVLRMVSYKQRIKKITSLIRKIRSEFKKTITGTC